MYEPSTPPGKIGSRRLKRRPPKVIESMKVQKTRPVGTGSEPFTFMRVGTHINTTREGVTEFSGRKEKEEQKEE